ncbi:hypothetical protein KOI35_19165 [Actinoplanes bogorensis]|uniref:Uncharacterized protein n=1 Tax=Paractinoplanes bogorensis TaxID=1610840 RepID=A0ABS5YQA8_9ACTN|nr:hypothetical protein [Actinoplanes bogorensis]MBU2665634.1 hypothetical protein [Actinoplanes bogorensis]
MLVEPSASTTDRAGSSAAEVSPAAEIAGYAPTAGARRQAFREGAGRVPGDPARATVAIIDVAHDPRRLAWPFACDDMLESWT